MILVLLSALGMYSFVRQDSKGIKVENGGLLFTDNPAGVSGTDGGYSIPMGDKTLWIFGDVFLLQHGPQSRYVSAVSNCGLLVPRGKGAGVLRKYRFLTDPKTALARQLLPYEQGDNKTVRLWPGAGWYDADHKKIYLFYQKVHTTGSGSFDFKVDGSGLAWADASDPLALRFKRIRVADRDVWWESPREPMFGCAVVTGYATPEPYLYIIGATDGRSKRARLARVRKEKVERLDSYEYFAGNPDSPHWSNRAADAVDIQGLEGFANEASISYNRWAGGYLAVYSLGGLSERIRISIAAHPWGPYHTLHEITAPKKALSPGSCYAGKEHPELAEDNGRIIYVTYVDSARYWLQLLRITLPQPPPLP